MEPPAQIIYMFVCLLMMTILDGTTQIVGGLNDPFEDFSVETYSGWHLAYSVFH